MAKINWEEGLDLEQQIAYIIREMEIYGVSFNKDKAIRQVRKLDGVMQRLYDKVRPFLTYYIEIDQTKATEDKLFKVDNHSEYLLKKGEYQFVKKIYLKNGEYSKSALMFYDPSLLAGPYSRVSFEEPTLSKRLKLVQQLLRHGWKPKEFTEPSKSYPNGVPQLTIKSEPVASLKQIGAFGESLSNWYICSHRKNQVQGFIDKLRPDGKLTPGCNPCATNTLRAKHRIIANLPRVTSFWGHQSRSLMIVPDNRWMVGADLAGLELRCLAHRMKDPEFIDLILNGDVHTYIQELLVLKDRDTAKTFIYAFIYGAGNGKLGSILDGSARNGKEAKRILFERIPALANLVKRVQNFVERNGWLPTLDNRKVYVRKYEGRLALHTSLNTLLQCDGAIIAKRSLLLSSKEITRRLLPAQLLIYYHDEFQWEVLDSYEHQVGQILVDSMEEAGRYYNLRIPITGEYKVGKNWSETH